MPALVISPRIPKGTIDHRQYDHASILKTLEDLFGLPALTNRDLSASSLLPLLTHTVRTDAPQTLPDAADSLLPECDKPAIPSADVAGVSAEEAHNLIQASVSSYEQNQSQDDVSGSIANSQRGFLTVALRKSLLMAPESERQRIVQDWRQIHTAGSARQYMANLAQRSRRQAKESVSKGGEDKIWSF